MKVKIEVTQKHIDSGKRADCYYCPIALAIMPKRTLLITPSLFFPLWGRETMKRLPREVRWFIASFDEKENVEPFSFDLFIPHRYLKV